MKLIIELMKSQIIQLGIHHINGRMSFTLSLPPSLDATQHSIARIYPIEPHGLRRRLNLLLVLL